MIRQGILFIIRYLIARLLGCCVSTRVPYAGTEPAVTWYVTTRDLHGPLLHTLLTGLARTRYPNLSVIILDNSNDDTLADVLRSNTWAYPVSRLRAQRVQSDWYRWIAQNATTDYWIASHDDLHFTGSDWVWDLIHPMLVQTKLGCVCGEDFPVRLNVMEPSGSVVDITHGLSTWLFAVRTHAGTSTGCNFDFVKQARVTACREEVWDQGGAWLVDLATCGWEVTSLTYRQKTKWQHFENFDWTRQSGDIRYQNIKAVQRRLVDLFVSHKIPRVP